MSPSTAAKTASANVGFPAFLTAYDPSDLPGGSLDPLGFERGYLFLADKILPGLTNVANRPRYFSILCAGAYLAEVSLGDPPRIQYQRRLDCIQRFERFWALANVLASQQTSAEEFPISGIRGVTYAADKAETLLRTGARRVDADFRLLLRQVPYGVVGIYGAVADGMRLLDRKTFTLTPDLGERLAEGFRDETGIPKPLIKAVRDGSDIAVGILTEWGTRAHISGDAVLTEQKCLAEALHRDPVRSRMADVLAAYPSRGEGESELQRLNRLLPACSSDPSNRDIKEAVSAILAYEVCYQLVMLAFERLLWLCRTLPAASISRLDLISDDVLRSVCDRLPHASRRLGEVLDLAQSEPFRLDQHRLEDTRRFLVSASAACTSPESLTREVMDRHNDVQRGKLDRGRRKLPWLEVTAGRISRAMTRVGGLDKAATEPAAIEPHPYRLSSADAMIAASGGQ